MIVNSSWVAHCIGDCMAYFALLGRLSGLALYHTEPLNAAWSSAFIKVSQFLPVARLAAGVHSDNDNKSVMVINRVSVF